MVYKKINEVADVLNGFAFKSKEYVSDGIRIMRIANVQDGYISDENPCFYPLSSKEEISNYLLKHGDLLISLTGNVGRVGILNSSMLPAALNQRVSCIRPQKDSLSTQYLYYYMLRKAFTQDCINASKGVAQLNLSTRWLEKYEIPVPSLDEQQRIVYRIEELFSSLDNAVETLQKTKEQLAVYRQAVLKEAFEKCPEHVSIESITHHVTDGDHMPPPKADAGIPFIMISNIYGNVICWDNTAFVGKEYFEKIDSKRKPQKGDVLYTVTGSYGIPVLVDCNKDFCFQRHIALLRPNETVTQKYLYYSLMEPNVFSQATKGATGTAQKTVGLGVLRKIKIPFIKGLTEQVKIVEEIEAKLSVCDSIEQTVNTALAQAEAMRQSILIEAFEGRL